MSALIIPFPRARRCTLEIAPHLSDWLVTHVREYGQRMVVAQRPTLEEAKSFAFRMAFELGRTRVVVLDDGRRA